MLLLTFCWKSVSFFTFPFFFYISISGLMKEYWKCWVLFISTSLTVNWNMGFFLNQMKTIIKKPQLSSVSSHLELNFIPHCIFNWKAGTCLGWDALLKIIPWHVWAIALQHICLNHLVHWSYRPTYHYSLSWSADTSRRLGVWIR